VWSEKENISVDDTERKKEKKSRPTSKQGSSNIPTKRAQVNQDVREISPNNKRNAH
jgi:hypothetical protein